ncbi:preprotein translocase subunit SecG [Aliidiomarina minuta]|uniref:Protein-export membrane protein SecG n=1 Tax=Aliidiomarina minuta TaxID=880057 RepID=A0A432W5E2_9GAMM|nr:preprotein translocase subunit SecG [Aliidiomarina minuta]RUO25262.1 preprotein translocase subunit SecG [Aliidiomarina minuta]
MYEIFLVLYLLCAIALIAMILMQRGKGADMGASFGGGGSNTVFGAAGSGNFLTRTTTILAVAFFLLSLLLGNLAAGGGDTREDWGDLSVPVVPEESQNELPPGN